MNAADDTIAAIATAPGRGGIGIVRLSGPEALDIGRRIAAVDPRPRHAHHCHFLDAAGVAIDDGLLIAFPGPASFTGEDVVELQGHGGPVVQQSVLRRCLELGARLARPGEFSERAFLNDRIDLVQAEAIADLIDASSEAAARGAMRSLQGVFSARIEALMDALTGLRGYVEAAMDFPDEDVDFLADGDVGERIEALREQVQGIIDEAGQGVLLADGMTLVLAGPPNAGKSSLMNRLTRRATAIVTEVPGTTRDLLRERIDLDGLPVHLIDTAGLRDSDDVVESEGVRRARIAIAEADVLLYVVDANLTAPTRIHRDGIEALIGTPPPAHVLLVRNKIDLTGDAPGRMAEPDTQAVPVLHVSAGTGAGFDELSAELKTLVGFAGAHQDAFTARTRHIDALVRSSAALFEARTTLADTAAGDLVAEDLRRAQDALGEIVGAVTPDDLLGHIFSSFCIGK